MIKEFAPFEAASSGPQGASSRDRWENAGSVPGIHLCEPRTKVRACAPLPSRYLRLVGPAPATSSGQPSYTP
jgi:hypothetical protein